MSRGACARCNRLLFHAYGDGPNICAACQDDVRYGSPLAPVIEPRPGEPWQPVLGTIGGKRYGS